ncbi:MAG: PKD domain-containing protein [Ignavibacteriae bacterium]|nr:PKD domain-containing protein [Ignavibacteriota bacterium]
MKTTFLFCIVFAITSVSAHSQCMQYPVPLVERIGGASAIIEGKIISQTSFPAGNEGMIYTRFTVEVYKIFKGLTDSEPKQIEITTEGGIYGSEAVKVNPSVNLSIGQTGVFFLQEHSKNNDFKGFEPFAWGQCVIWYDEQSRSAADIFKKYSGSTFLYDAIFKQLGNSYREMQSYNPKSRSIEKSARTLAANISGFTPTTITGGTNSTLTINGSGFGNSYSGQAAVAFKNPDDGGATYSTAGANRIVSWTDNQIQVKVPDNAGTGTIRVTGVDGSQSVSGTSLIIDFVVFNVNDANGNAQQTYLVNSNGNGGYTHTFNTNFNNNTDANAAFKRALKAWRCNTFVNYAVATGTSNVNCNNGNDGINIVTFDDNCTLGAGVLGITYTYWSGCNVTYYRLREMDLIFKATAPVNGWNFGPGATTGNKYDFQSVVVHELGHGHQLGHIISAGKVMHYALGANSDVRNLNTVSDIGGGNDVVNRSINNKPCGPTAMNKLNSGNCDVGIPPTAAFTATPLQGCVPLTVNFTDQSTDSPTSWNWDFKNDGSVTSTSQNSSYTYTVPGTYSVQLTASNSSGSNSLTKTNYITVYALPTIDAGTNTTVCYGSNFQLGGTPTAAGTTPPYVYSWSPVTNLDNSTSANPILTALFTVPTVYTLTVTDAKGCVSQKTVTISIFPRTAVNAGIDKFLCYGSGSGLGGAPTASGGAPHYQYSWIPSIGLDNAAIANPIASPTVNTMYVATVTDANNCVVRDTVVITMYPKATISAGVDKSVCIGSSVAIGGAPTASGVSAPFTYSWLPVTGLSSATNSNPTASPTVTTDYVLTVTDANGCTSKDTVKVTVNPLPVPTITSTRPTTFCEGDSTILDAGAFKSYLWSNNQTTQIITVKQAGNYTVKVVNTNDCEATSVPVPVIVQPKPVPVIISQKPATFCQGDNTVLDAGAGYKSYLWSNGATTQTITVTTADAYSVTVSNANDCKAQSQPINVVVNPKPAVEISGPNSLCNNSIATYSVPAIPAGSFQWNVTGGTLTSGNGTNSITVQWGTVTGSVSLTRTVSATNCSASGTYPVVISSTLTPEISRVSGRGCEGEDVVLSAPAGYSSYKWSSGETSQSITVRSNGTFTVTVKDANNCEGTSLATAILFTPPPPKPSITQHSDTLFSSLADGYEWKRNSVIIPNQTKQFIVINELGKYTVTVSDSKSCSSVSDEFEVTSTAVEEQYQAGAIHIYPNPTDGDIQIDIPFGEIECRISNVLGMTVAKYTLQLGKTTVSLSDFPAGIYSVEFTSGNQRFVQVITKQ